MMSKLRRKNPGSIVMSFRRDDEGVAAIEFAFVFPLMLLIFFGMLEIKHSLQMAAKTELLSYTLSDLVATKSTGGDATGQAALIQRDIEDILEAGMAILWPFSISFVHVEVDEIQIRQDGAYLTWSVTVNSDAMRECGKLKPGENYKFTDIPRGLLEKSYAQGLEGAPATGVNIIVVKVKYSDDHRVFRRIVTDALLPVKWSYAIERNTYGPIQFKAWDAEQSYGTNGVVADVKVQDCNPAPRPSTQTSPLPPSSASSP